MAITGGIKTEEVVVTRRLHYDEKCSVSKRHPIA
jgi:hypothetical protein